MPNAPSSSHPPRRISSCFFWDVLRLIFLRLSSPPSKKSGLANVHELCSTLRKPCVLRRGEELRQFAEGVEVESGLRGGQHGGVKVWDRGALARVLHAGPLEKMRAPVRACESGSRGILT